MRVWCCALCFRMDQARVGDSNAALKEKKMSKRRALITGASKGIGREVANRLAAGEFEVIGVARTTPSVFPGQFYEVDLSDRSATADMLDEIVAGG
jgi:3-oxoacyl-[acyl-carrier protein] reductase